MPFNNPISKDNLPPERGSGQTRGTGSLVQAERVMQIAFVLPCALLIGWGAGWWVDHHFHTHWATVVGLVLGIVSGMISAIRMAMQAMNSSSNSSSRKSS